MHGHRLIAHKGDSRPAEVDDQHHPNGSQLTSKPQLVRINYPSCIRIDHASPRWRFVCPVWRVLEITVPAPSNSVCLRYYNPYAKRHVVGVTVPMPSDLSMTWVLQSRYSGAHPG